MPIEDWLYHLIPEFKLYWLERDILRCWDSTFWVHAKSEWEKVDKSRMYRTNGSTPLKETQKQRSHGLTERGNLPPPITPEQSIENFNRQAERFNLK